MPCIGVALGAALVQHQGPINPSPCFGKLAVRCPLGREPGLVLLACGKPGIGNKCERFVEVVTKEVVVGPGAFKSSWCYPVRIVD